MPDYVVERLENALAKNKKPLLKSKILIQGLSYKKNVDDFRDSPSLIIIKKLVDKGAQVEYSDPIYS